MTFAEWVDSASLVFAAIMSWLGQYVSLLNSHVFFGVFIALFVLGLVFDLFKYITPRR